MGLFWKRKSGDQFVSLRLNEPAVDETRAEDREEETRASVRPGEIHRVTNSSRRLYSNLQQLVRVRHRHLTNRLWRSLPLSRLVRQ